MNENAITFFKSSFNIEARQEDVDIIWQLVMVIKTWLEKKCKKYGIKSFSNKNTLWTKFKNGSCMSTPDKRRTFYCESTSFESGSHGEKDVACKHWACRITETPEREEEKAPRQWISDFVYEEVKNKGRLDVVVRYSDKAGYIGPYGEQPEITVPGFMILILENYNLRCHSMGIDLCSKAIELKDREGVFFKELIYDETRELPIIYISPQKKEENSINTEELLVSPDEITKCVMGNAFVYYSRSMEFSEEINYLLGDKLKCYPGNIRVYSPGIKKDNLEESSRHRYIAPSHIDKWGGKEELLKIFRKAFAQSSYFYKRIRDYDDCLFMKRLEEETIKLKKEANDWVDEAALIDEELKNAKASHKGEKRELERKIQVLESRLKEMRADSFVLNSQISQFVQSKGEGLSASKKLEIINCFRNLPENQEQVAQIIERVFPDAIAFSEKAWKSLEDCGTDLNLLWSILFGMATDFYDLLRAGASVHEAAEDFAKKVGVGYARSEGMMTRKDSKLMHGYKDEYDGKEINIEPHFKKGNKGKDKQFIRLHFAWDREKRRIIVGHCGEHIDNYSTRKQH